MTEKCVTANMQDDSSSFEGWSLAFKKWLADVEHVELSWDAADDIRNTHYQRFLYRVQQFLALFSPWFSVTSPQNQDDLTCLRTSESTPLVVTSAKGDRSTKSHNICRTLEEAIANERKLECYIRDNHQPLAQLLGLEYLDRQLPVGLFNDDVKTGNEIFPRANSMIDLWGIRDNELILFELKAAGNTKVGVLSELFFYSYIMEGVQIGRYTLQDANEAISSTTAVRTYILAPKWHPLIDDAMLGMANAAFRTAGRNIRFGLLAIRPEQEEYTLNMLAGDEKGATA